MGIPKTSFQIFPAGGPVVFQSFAEFIAGHGPGSAMEQRSAWRIGSGLFTS
jgi:hypothetical protein